MANTIEKINLGLARLRPVDGRMQIETAFLHLETYIPGAGGVRSLAIVYWMGAKGSRTHSCGLAVPPNRDFTKELVYDRDGLDIQERLNDQHARAFTADVAAELIAQAKAHYASRYIQAKSLQL